MVVFKERARLIAPEDIIYDASYYAGVCNLILRHP
jgi:hypothetical protein